MESCFPTQPISFHQDRTDSYVCHIFYNYSLVFYQYFPSFISFVHKGHHIILVLLITFYFSPCKLYPNEILNEPKYSRNRNLVDNFFYVFMETEAKVLWCAIFLPGTPQTLTLVIKVSPRRDGTHLTLVNMFAFQHPNK